MPAIDFAAASSQYLSLAAALASVAPITLAVWHKPATFTTNQTLLSIGNSGNSNAKCEIAYRGDVASDPYRATYGNSSSAATCTTTTGISSSIWAHACGVFTSATSRAVYVNAGSVGTNTTNITTPAYNRTSVGRTSTSSANNFADGAIAYACAWGVALSLTQVTQLAAGAHPLDVEPDSLLLLLPMLDSLDLGDLVTNGVWTANAGPTTSVDGPPVDHFVLRNHIYVPVASSLTGAADLSVDADAVAVTGATTLTGTADLAVDADNAVVTGFSPLTGTADLAVDADNAGVAGSGAFTGTADLAVVADNAGVTGVGAVVGTADTAVDADGGIVTDGGGVPGAFTGTADLAVVADNAGVTGATALTGTADLAVDADGVVVTGIGHLTGDDEEGGFTGTADLAVDADGAVVTGETSLTGAADLAVDADGAVVVGLSPLTGTADTAVDADNAVLTETTYAALTGTADLAVDADGAVVTGVVLSFLTGAADAAVDADNAVVTGVVLVRAGDYASQLQQTSYASQLQQTSYVSQLEVTMDATVGGRARARLLIKNEDSVADDPDALTLTVVAPDGTNAVLTYPADIARVAAGDYRASFVVTAAGRWTWRWHGLGGCEGASPDYSFWAQPTAVANPAL